MRQKRQLERHCLRKRKLPVEKLRSHPPAAAAYQLTYSIKRMFLPVAGFGVLSGWMGLLFSYLFNIPSGVTIVVTSSLIFMLAAIFSPKRKVKGWRENPATGE